MTKTKSRLKIPLKRIRQYKFIAYTCTCKIAVLERPEFILEVISVAISIETIRNVTIYLIS